MNKSKNKSYSNKSRSNKRRSNKRTSTKTKLKITTIYYNNILQKKGWATISRTSLYISRDNNRIYWIWAKDKSIKPKIRFNEKKLSITIGNNKIIAKNNNEFIMIHNLLSN